MIRISRSAQPSALLWFGRGASAAASLPGLILASAFVGFAGLAREAGFSLFESLLMVLSVWALPSMVVLVGAVQAGSGLVAAVVAVSLSAVRLMPMVMVLVPEMRGAKTRRWVPYLLSHFIAVTSWVMSLQRFPNIPRDARTSFYAGLAVMLMAFNVTVVAVVYLALPHVPAPVAAGLIFLTPMYFLTSLWGAAREKAGLAAMAFGVVLGPVLHAVLPQGDILAAGIAGGVFAYAFHRIGRARS